MIHGVFPSSRLTVKRSVANPSAAGEQCLKAVVRDRRGKVDRDTPVWYIYFGIIRTPGDLG
jgi:hypothetical protein